MEGHRGFRGGATIYLDRQKIEVQADLFSSDNPDASPRWWGTYYADSKEKSAVLEPGATAYVRFSDGSDAQVRLLTTDGLRGSGRSHQPGDTRTRHDTLGWDPARGFRARPAR
jgi:hypothetical protein